MRNFGRENRKKIVKNHTILGEKVIRKFRWPASALDGHGWTW